MVLLPSPPRPVSTDVDVSAHLSVDAAKCFFDLWCAALGLAPPVSKSAAANPAARSPRFVFPAFLSRTQTLPSSAKKSEKKRDSKGENTPPSPIVFTPHAGASDSTAPSLVALNSQRSQTQREEESRRSGDKEGGNSRDTLAEVSADSEGAGEVFGSDLSATMERSLFS
uniref:Uncharacterized protein n=1 Tax=Toxoplasma gondii COUG TaxID=1074873 RepID=A0A2G8Y1Y2_TOXGO|nr:hypothetical protein TGCOUG_393140 [Toxoplasma gondii COUG]